MRQRIPLILLLSLVFTGGVAPAVSAQTPGQTPPVKIDRQVSAYQQLALEVGQNRLLILSEPVGRVSVADPAIADFKVITQNQLLLTARGTGTTDLTMWNKQEEPMVIALTIARNLDPLRGQLKEFFPDQKIEVSSAGALVVLSGEVTDVRVPERAAEVARLHSERVVNLIKVTGNQQVQLEVKFAEVSRRGIRAMGMNFLHMDQNGNRVGGLVPPPPQALGEILSIPGTSRIGGGPPPVFPPSKGNAFSLFFSSFPKFPFSVAVSLLESNGLAKILAEPTLVAMSGQDAKFLSGGEFPVPFAQAFGQTSIQWKHFGIILNFVPTVLGDGNIQLRLQTEVSDIDTSRQVQLAGFSIPGLTSRQSETTIRLADGQSFAIAGLLSNQIRSQIDKIPILGDIPILGALFRSVDYRRDESELLVVVTARLAQPLAPHQVPALPTDQEMNDPNDFMLFLMGSEDTSKPPQKGGDKQRGVPNKQAFNQSRGPAGQIGFIR